jgi:hypothetical protein
MIVIPVQRKIIQISSCGVMNNMVTQSNFVIIALCNDGTVWQNRDTSGMWEHLESIPQVKVI